MIELKGWDRFSANKDKKRIRRWLSEVRAKSQQTFAAGMLGPHSGIIYRRRGGDHQASKAGEYPANDTGKLLRSLRSKQTRNRAVIGTNVHYAKWLREGTRKMARRRMSDNALRTGGVAARRASRGWARWKKGKSSVRNL